MKSSNIKSLYIFLFFFVFTATAFAQSVKPQGKVSGLLMDEQGKGMDYATVSLLSAKDSLVVKGALSNETGLYVFDHINAGNYIIKSTAVGFEKAISNVFSISEDLPNFTVPVLKMRSASRTLNAVTITSSKPLIERKVDRTVMNVENSILATGNSAMEILERAPGVSVDKDDNISIKGKQGVTVMINDKLTYLSSSQLATLLRSTDGTTISSIEIITNPSAKYDASGNSGIINIKLKKNKQAGTNGSVTAGVGYGEYGKDNETLSLNHKEGNLNVFGSFSHNDNKRVQNIGLQRIITDTKGNVTYFNQFSSLPQANHNNSYRLGADYDLSAKNTIGFLVNGYFNGAVGVNSNNTFIGPNFTSVDSSLTTATNVSQTFHNIAFNLNDLYRIDTAGQQISIDLDYSQFKNNALSQYTTNFFLANGSQQHTQAFLGNLTPSVINIRTGKVDYTKPITKSLKFESGLKFSDVKTDNNLMQSLTPTGAYQSNNHFVYDEIVDAVYVNLSKDFKNTSVQAGLRAEYTRSDANGDSLNVIQNIQRHYLDLFPSIFIQHTFNDKNEIGISYSRRVDRPQYDNLNPFVYHLDPYTYQKGNPFLKPEYTDNFEVNYTYKKNTTISLGYSHTTDVITNVPGTDPATKVAFVTNLNLQVQNNYNINIFSSYTVAKWWTGNVNATGFYLGVKSNGLEGANLDRGQAAYQIRTTQTFLPLPGYKAELTSSYQSALTAALFNVLPQYSTDAGISYTFANKNATIKLSISDIFNTRNNDVVSIYQNNNITIHQKNESRITRITFTYNFGNHKIKLRQHKTGADDEKGRVTGGN